MNFNRINNIVGWIVCIIASATYILTAEFSGSLWDCGEFVSSCFKLQIPHPPGAPLFVLLGRFFIILFGDNPMTAAKGVNVMSALASGFTILFLFWTITHFARKALTKAGEALTNNQVFAIMGAGAVGALAYTYSDSFWYSAVEGEVYALSSFFTAIVFWAILKWEHAVDHEEATGINADRWIVFIFFLMGLSIGVHLLNLLTIPAIVMVYYYKRYKVTTKGVLWAFLIGCVITGFVQKAVIQYTINGAGAFDIFMVNSMGMPLFTGFIIFFILLAAAIWYGLKVAKRKHWGFLHIGLWSVAFMLIGYSTYITTMIRSNADPAVDMYNVDNPMSLVGYLGREQYGDFPLVYGQKFTAGNVKYKSQEYTDYDQYPFSEPTSKKWMKGVNPETKKAQYLENGTDYKTVFHPSDMMIFPRVWDPSNDQGHGDYYAQFLGIDKLQDGSYDREPTFGDNIKFFIAYQTYWMYFRYFMWNFSGKQNDVQGVWSGNVRDGNWITGISFIDNMLYGDQSLMPDSSKNNKAHNTLFLLPFILGIIGIFYHHKAEKRDSFVVFLLFFFTGMAIVLYLNQAGNQPRERDYAYVGSFYAFAIWIGLGVLQVREWFAKVMARGMATNLATALCLLAVPLLMAAQEWDDHDRSKKLLARDLAKDYLESCAPNAVLFSFGDNDTYPLWYAQEVEGIRPDIRVINYSLLGIDWYINQMRYKVNQSPAIKMFGDADKVQGRKRDYVPYKEISGVSPNQYFYLSDVVQYIYSDDPNKMAATRNGDNMSVFPSRKVSIPVDVNLVKRNGTVGLADNVVPEVKFEITKAGLYKNDLAVLDVIAANNWERPIYFTSAFDELGFGAYLRKDGLSYRLVPVAEQSAIGQQINTDWMKDKLMNKFGFGNANLRGVYFDEENRRHLNTIRSAYAELAIDLASKGRKEEGRQILAKADKMMLQENMPYGMISRYNSHNRVSLLFLQACYSSDDKALAGKVLNSIRKDLQQQTKFYNSLSPSRQALMQQDIRITESYLQELTRIEQSFSGKTASPENGGAIMNPARPAARPDGTALDSGAEKGL
jgi:hypothetical protein